MQTGTMTTPTTQDTMVITPMEETMGATGMEEAMVAILIDLDAATSE
jgi:hypothetical protein